MAIAGRDRFGLDGHQVLVVGLPDGLHKLEAVDIHLRLLHFHVLLLKVPIVDEVAVDDGHRGAHLYIVEIVGEEVDLLILNLREGVALSERIEGAIDRIQEVANGEVDLATACGEGVGTGEIDGGQEEALGILQAEKATLQAKLSFLENQIARETFLDVGIERSLCIQAARGRQCEEQREGEEGFGEWA